MLYTNLGTTGCRVSRICLGCMSFGDNRWAPYVIDEKESLPLIKKAYDAGINFFDTGKGVAFTLFYRVPYCNTLTASRSKRVLSRSK